MGESKGGAQEGLKYVIVTKDDANILLATLLYLKQRGEERGAGGAKFINRIADQLRNDAGTDLEAMARQLRQESICVPCSVEGQAELCGVLVAQKIGRRLNRLLAQSRGESIPPESDRPPSLPSLEELAEEIVAKDQLIEKLDAPKQE